MSARQSQTHASWMMSYRPWILSGRSLVYVWNESSEHDSKNILQWGRFDACGVVDESSKYLTQAYKKKDYLGDVIGREDPPWLSMLFLSKGARRATAPLGTIKSDISKAAFEGAAHQKKCLRRSFI